ncbi:uncharacterized protein LOC143882502 [Tasmannia lanceolata]|uniref:uncharacterized protein LOC143882502 n=1 Tax=Tasmannia lanceolata TaxID=3420 RepID=UPI0040639768
MFLLIANLSGFKKDNIKIEINQEGTEIAISGEKYIQEMVMVRWRMCTKETEIRRFKKVFRIPDGVVLDRIDAKFDEENSVLTIFMPKLMKGFLRINIEEVVEEEEEDEEIDYESPETMPITTYEREIHEIPAGAELPPISEQKRINEKGEDDQVGVTLETIETENEIMPEEITPTYQMPDSEIPPLEPVENPGNPKILEPDREIHGLETPEPKLPGIRINEIIPEEITTDWMPDSEIPPIEAVESPGNPEIVDPMEHEPDREIRGSETPDQNLPETRINNIILEEITPTDRTPASESPPLEAVESPGKPEILNPIQLKPDREIHGSETPDQTLPETIISEMTPEEITPTDRMPDSEIPPLEAVESPGNPEIVDPMEVEPVQLERDREIHGAEKTPDQMLPDMRIAEDLQEPSVPDEKPLTTEIHEAPKVETKTPIQDPQEDEEEPATKIQEPAGEIVEEPMELEPDQQLHQSEAMNLQSSEQNRDQEQEIPEVEAEIQGEKESDQRELPEEADLRARETAMDEEKKKEGKRRRGLPLCPPCLFTGSAFIISLIVLVIHLLRKKKQ